MVLISKMTGKEFHIPSGVEGQEMEIEDLKDDDKVIWYTNFSGLGKFDLEVDGGFIRRLGRVVKKYQEEVKLEIVGKTIFAVVSNKGTLKEEREYEGERNLFFN